MCEVIKCNGCEEVFESDTNDTDVFYYGNEVFCCQACWEDSTFLVDFDIAVFDVDTDSYLLDMEV